MKAARARAASTEKLTMLNIQNLRKTGLMLAVAGFVWWAWKAPAQDTSATGTAPLPYGIAQVIKLEQARIGDDTVIAYINNSGDTYALNAGQIIYLRQQGVSDAVLTAMLTQSRAAAASAVAPQYAAPAPQATVDAQPPVNYVQTAPADYSYDNYPTYYYPNYSSYYPYYNYYGYYGWPWRVGWGWGWYGGGWHWGWHGGGNAGWHGSWGGGWHGGGWTGGGWHGSVGGGWHGGGAWHGGGGGWHGGGGGHQ
jgi:hypothetical protein